MGKIIGNSLPRYIRPSLPQIPATSSLLTSTHLPLGLVINPFAAPRYDEAPIPYVNSFLQSSTDGGDVGGPPRCTKCRGYINPWCKFVDGGVKWVCNLCNGSNPGKSDLTV
jgi:protein transport protein SEC24